MPAARPQQASRPVRLPDLHTGLRHLPACLQADVPREGLHAAAGAAADRRLHAGKLAGPLRRREHRAGDRCGLRLGGRRDGHRHAHPGRADPRHPAPRQGRRQGHGAGRAVGVGSARDVPGLRLPSRRRNGRRDGPDRPRDRREPGPSAATGRRPDQGPAAAHRVSAAGLRQGAVRQLSARHGAVLLRLPVSLRVLRHSGSLRPPAAHEDAAADRRRAGFHFLAAEPADHALLRRRQFHRQSQGRQGDAAASRRMAEAQPLSR